MAIQTKLAIVQEIKYSLFGGIEPNTGSFSDNYVLRLVNNFIADAAIKSAYQSTNIDGITYADDIFNIRYDNQTLVDDTIYGLKKVHLPALPVGLPRNRSISVTAQNTEPTMFKPINRFEWQRMKSLPNMAKVYYFIESNSAYFDFSYVSPIISVSAVSMVMTTSGAMDLSAEVNLPDDMIQAMKLAVVTELRQSAIPLGVPITQPHH